MGGECGREGGGQDGVEWGGKWDNCNSIINKYIKKKRKWRQLYLNNNKKIKRFSITKKKKKKKGKSMCALISHQPLQKTDPGETQKIVFRTKVLE